MPGPPWSSTAGGPDSSESQPTSCPSATSARNVRSRRGVTRRLSAGCTDAAIRFACATLGIDARRTREGRGHRRGRPDRLCPPVPHRIGPDVRARTTGRPAAPRDRARPLPALEGVAMELDDCAFPLLQVWSAPSTPTRLSPASTGRCWSARVPRKAGHGAQGPAHRQRRHLHRPGPGHRATRPPTCASWSSAIPATPTA